MDFDGLRVDSQLPITRLLFVELSPKWQIVTEMINCHRNDTVSGFRWFVDGLSGFDSPSYCYRDLIPTAHTHMRHTHVIAPSHGNFRSVTVHAPHSRNSGFMPVMTRGRPVAHHHVVQLLLYLRTPVQNPHTQLIWRELMMTHADTKIFIPRIWQLSRTLKASTLASDTLCNSLLRRNIVPLILGAHSLHDVDPHAIGFQKKFKPLSSSELSRTQWLNNKIFTTSLARNWTPFEMNRTFSYHWNLPSDQIWFWCKVLLGILKNFVPNTQNCIQVQRKIMQNWFPLQYNPSLNWVSQWSATW